jgi:hypothetical protein
MCENASLFLVYNQLQLAIRWASGIQVDAPLGLGHLAIAAAGAGSIVSFILYGGFLSDASQRTDAFLLSQHPY